MSGFYTEADYENSIIELFQNMWYWYVYAADLERDFRSPLYEEELMSALHRLNPKMPEDAITDALFKLKNFENAELGGDVMFLKGMRYVNHIPWPQNQRIFHDKYRCSPS